MRSILAMGKLRLLPILLSCVACGGGGGGAAPVATLAELQTTIDIPNPGEKASVLVEVRSDGTLLWSAAVPVDLVLEVTGLTLNRVSDASVLADLLDGGSFDGVTGAATGAANVTAAEAAELAADPGDFIATLLTSTKPPASGGLGTFTAAEWHTVLLGSNEVTVVDAAARGAASFRVTSPTTIHFVLAMVSPAAADVTGAHIHVGEPGINGAIVVDLDTPDAVLDAAAGTLSGTVSVDGQTLARLYAGFEGFYCNAHTATAPNGMVRGQLDAGGVQMWAALSGAEETPPTDPTARGGFTVEFETLTSGRAILAVPSDMQQIDDVGAAHIHVGDPGVPGTILVDLRGPGYSTSPLTGSAEGGILYTQEQFTRILANPPGFYANFHTLTAPNGLVRGQLTRDPVTFFADLSGAEETTSVPGGAGAMTVVVTAVHECAFTVTMQSPPAADLTAGHIHDGPAGADGPGLADLLGGTGVALVGQTITGRAEVPGRTFARMLAAPQLFYGNVHTAANPLGVARGQFARITGDTPPAGLVYASPVVYQTGAPIAPNSPSSVGGAISSYAIVPALPAGLSVDPTTGIISGTPTATQLATNHTVTASNAAGSTTATVNITVNEGPPLSLSYQTPVSYVVGTAITPNSPVSTGGAITSYGVSPALPGGLSLSPTTGVLSGTPTAAAAAANYTITGSNSAGQAQAVVNITVAQNLQPPSGLSYTTPVSYGTGYAITPNTPTVSGGPVANWSVSPSLPAGLTLNSNGSITGTPTTVTSAANYVVTASNAAGSTNATVNIAVTLGVPGTFTYSNDPNLAYVNFAIATMSPTHSSGGPVSSYSVSPALPSGLSLNTTTGVISGTPSVTDLNGTTYTVTAANSAGTRTTTVNITILP